MSSPDSIISEAEMDVLEIDDVQAAPWLRRQLPPLHLLLGDSVARDAGVRSRLNKDAFLQRAYGGATWKSLSRNVPEIIREWSQEAASQGRRLGSAVLWLTGNDVYSRHSGMASFPENRLAETAGYAVEVCRALARSADRIFVLGPLPRLSGEVTGTRWEQTAAFHLERRLHHQMPAEVYFIRWGRQLLKKSLERYSCIPDCQVWFQADGTHLTAAGYGKLADAAELPIWLKLAAAE